ncbi:MAG: hypothetical protein H6779_00500 [Candidatus Nomurabacteria bacterium]|nr:hypothetical protein [Candidatus Nomurabacteria bacterium]USN87910.1 MAG: hypothetical protein H6779_00500 [Candidatus Nomurabacteria bacterium]
MTDCQSILLCTGSFDFNKLREFVKKNPKVMLWYFSHESNIEVESTVEAVATEFQDLKALSNYILHQVGGINVPDQIVEEFSKLPIEICGQPIELPYNAVAPINLLLLVSVLASIDSQKEILPSQNVKITWFIKTEIPSSLSGVLERLLKLFPKVNAEVETLPA